MLGEIVGGRLQNCKQGREELSYSVEGEANIRVHVGVETTFVEEGQGGRDYVAEEKLCRESGNI